MRIRYFQDVGGHIAVTPETPKGPLRGLVFVGRGPTAPGRIDTIKEQTYVTEQLQKLSPISALAVSDEWIKAIGYEQHKPQPVFAPPSPDPKPQRQKPRKRGQPIIAESLVIELVVGSPHETPILNRLLWLAGLLILLGIHLLARW